MLFDQLTPDQLRAAIAPQSVAVTAGAGTGKTTMLAARYLFHVKEQGMSPLEVVAVTFTKKAAAELRSRIRAALLAENIADELVAEVDAAQISTVHSLAERICKDFYRIAEIPPDFTILDETVSPMWLAEEFNSALADIDQPIIDELGFEFLKDGLWQLLNDPHGTNSAFAAGTERWEEMVNTAAADARQDLLDSYEWNDALAVCSNFQGAADDKLEERRRNILTAMSNVGPDSDIRDAAAAIIQFSRVGGAKGKWPDGGLEEVKDALAALKEKTNKAMEILSLKFGDDDRELIRRVGLLEQAYRQVAAHLKKAKRREKVLDFNDLEINAVKILCHPDGEAVRHYARRWKAILVDEFQDTNPVQAELLQLIGANAIQTIVGDEKQSIYGFRGADVSVFQRYRENISASDASSDVRLSLTFRTHSPLVRRMNDVFSDLMGELHQELESEIAEPAGFGGEYISLRIVQNGTGKDKKNKKDLNRIEAVAIAEKIKEMVSGDARIVDQRTRELRQVEYRDIAVLSRTWEPLGAIAETLDAEGIPNVNVGGGELLKTTEARDIISLLGFLAEPSDDIHLVAALRSPFFAVSDIELYDIAVAMPKGQRWWAALEKASGRSGEAYRILKEILEARLLSACETLALADRLTGYTAAISNLPGGERRLADYSGMLALLRSLDEQGRGDVFGTVRHLRALSEAKVELPRPQLEVGQAVALMTIHASKGLEWPIVFIPDLSRKRGGRVSSLLIDREAGIVFKLETDEQDPKETAIHKVLKRRAEERETAETRRVLYVGMTRSRDSVFLTSAEEKGNTLDMLMPGVLKAGLAPEVIAGTGVDAAGSGSTGALVSAKALRTEQISAVHLGLRSIPATALAIFRTCPREFRKRYIDRHPGERAGSGIKSAVGTLTHKALELDIHDIDALRRYGQGRPDDQLTEALDFAKTFRSHQNFAGLDLSGARREVAFEMDFAGIRLVGTADLVCEDMVLDFKTGMADDPSHHYLQMWVYSRAFNKTKAYLAFLRTAELHEVSAKALELAEAEAKAMIERIAAGDFGLPNGHSCKYCSEQKQ